MRLFNRVAIFMIIYLALLNYIIPFAIPDRIVYNYRINFDIVKNDISNIDAALEHVKRTIEKEKIKSYVIILGDSVAYGSPGPAHGSIGYYLNKLSYEDDKDICFFNLAIPAMQTGDVYTMLLKLWDYDISTDNLIINIWYSNFVKRTYGHPVATWLSEELRKMDYEAYERVENNLICERISLNQQKHGKAVYKDRAFAVEIKNKVQEHFNMLKYKDYLRGGAHQIYEALRGRIPEMQAVQPWYEKAWLVSYMKREEIQWYMNDEPFRMDTHNEDIFFWERILKLQENKNTLVFLAAINEKLLPRETSRQGYKENLKRITDYFSCKDIDFIDFNGKTDYGLFSDHVHLTPKGYRYIAGVLWERVKNWKMNIKS
ncbi:MAG: hypothetical protein ACOZCL_01380 [Bacillota bacterium]